jgi:hypothetical protein
MDCRLFDSPAQAFAEVLREAPAILAVGEFHARKRHEGLRTATARFSEELLPSLQGRASDIVIELWVGTGKCDVAQQQVAREQQPVTQDRPQATPNQFLALGDHAKALGVRPHPLEPTCDDFNRVLQAGDGAVLEMLELTARMFASRARLLFQRNQAVGSDKMIVTYSGAMHNDLRPDHTCGEPCCFGKQLQTLAGGRYVEVDLVVPEYIGQGQFWQDRVWYPHFDRTALHTKTTLFRQGPGSYVLIFPSTPGWKPPPDPG